MILQIVGLLVLIAVLVAGVRWIIQNVSFKKTEK